MQTSFERFIDDNARALLGSAYLLTGDRHAAEDLVQDAETVNLCGSSGGVIR